MLISANSDNINIDTIKHHSMYSIDNPNPLRFNPYDNKTNHNYLQDKNHNETPEDFFWNNLFVDYPPTCKKTVEAIIKAVRDISINTISFYGPSGTGKTTFLHYVERKARRLYSSFYGCDFVNLIEKPGSTESQSMMVSLLNHKIEQNLTENVANQLIDSYDKYIQKNSKKIGTWESDFLKDVEEKASERYNYFPQFYQFLGKSAFGFSLQDVQHLCDKIIPISEKIALYIICFIINKCYDNNKKSILVFDNLDELDGVYLSQLLENELYTAQSKAQSFFETYMPEYKFKANCTIITSIRINHAFHYKPHQQRDRMGGTSKEIAFECRADAYEIIKKRCNYRDGDIFPLINLEKVYVKNVISRLYNQDLRAVMFSFDDVVYKPQSPILYDILEDSDCKVIGRGCVLFRVLQARNNVTDAPFMSDATNAIRSERCDLLRMALTLLANMSNSTELNYSTDDIPNANRNRISLLEFTDRMKSWYEDTLSVKDLYKTIFVASSHNYSMPATLVGYPIEQQVKKNSKTGLQEISDYCAEQYETHREMLEGVEIVVHPLCEVYAKYIFIHFEYFNSLALLDETCKNLSNPCCSLLECQNVEESIRCMERVYRTAIKIIKKADNNFCEKCQNSTNCIHGKESLNCKLNSEKMNHEDFLINNTLYASRIITSHINYLDAYRKYVWKKRDRNKDTKLNALIKKITEYIEKYAKMCNIRGETTVGEDFRRKVYDATIVQSINEIEKNLAFQKRNENMWVTIKEHSDSNPSISDVKSGMVTDNYIEVNGRGRPLHFDVNGCGFLMVPVEGGIFEIGDENDIDATKHKVKLNSYYIGETLVTQKLWSTVMGNNPSLFVGENNPVERVSWNDCHIFLEKLNDILGQSFRLPSEAEWEYAARGGYDSPIFDYSGSNEIDDVAWYDNNSYEHTHPVKCKKNNKLGLYDMSGNVCEWCRDWYEYFSPEDVINPLGPSNGKTRVIRGGSWFNGSDYCMVSSRYHYAPEEKEDFIGFRLALDK